MPELLGARSTSTTLAILGICDNTSGYGQMVTRLGRELELATGRRVQFTVYHSDKPLVPLDPFMVDRLVEQKPDHPCLAMGGPWTAFPDGSAILTMWEATRLRPDDAANLNRASVVIVPCSAVAEWFAGSGVTVPIRVVPLGIDPTVFYPRTRPRGRNFTFGASGRHVGRKGLMAVMIAFLAEFELMKFEMVRLELKVYSDTELDTPGDHRIKVIREDWSEATLAGWYSSLDTFVSASRGEGWGLQPHQAMACGTPVIAPIWGGHAAYMTERSGWPLDYSERLATGHYETEGSKWCEVYHGSLTKQMRRAFTHREVNRLKGLHAEARAHKFIWSRSARELIGVLDEFGFLG
jgi:glycosyltransferase involved in cell wall biosynthesis